MELVMSNMLTTSVVPEDSRVVRAVVFDAFGTLFDTVMGRHPYRQLFQLAKAGGRKPTPEDSRSVMTIPMSLAGCADWLGINLSMRQLADIEDDLQAELCRIRFYSDAKPAIAAAKKIGIKVGVCSNLAQPYGVIAKVLLADLPIDAAILSYEVGAIKPDPFIYRSVCNELDLPPSEIHFVGDSYENDVAGPRAFGMNAAHLVRSHEASGSPDMDFIRELSELDFLRGTHAYQ
jgi:HAD superfamily hydrolase (TIGR01549 family)